MVIPKYIISIIKQLQDAHFSVELVGGCVRDILLGRPIKDWDLTTNAHPEEILLVFDEAKYENDFATVMIPVKEDGRLVTVVEITTYRSEKAYSDRRHPDEIKLETELDKDLERRDFTINAMALRLTEGEGTVVISGYNFELVDLFGGQKDLKKKIIRAVGEPIDRFKEDALRMMRAIRFSAQLDFSLEPKTQRAITKMAGSIKFVAKERIRDEFIKILLSEQAATGLLALHEAKLLQYIIPELEKGIGVEQNHHHTYQVFKHNVLSLKYCPSQEWQVRLAALFHDVGKPSTKRFINGMATFYNHEYVGAKMTDRIMLRLKFKNEDRERVVNLVKNHMFYYNVGEVTAASVRRLINKVGRDNLQDLIHLRVADRLGSGTPKAMPYKLRHLQYMMEKVQNDPVSVKMLKVNGHDLINNLNLAAGPKLGAILDVLLGEVLENPELNDRQLLLDKALHLDKEDLDSLRKKAQDLIKEKIADDDKDMQRKFKV